MISLEKSTALLHKLHIKERYLDYLWIYTQWRWYIKQRTIYAQNHHQRRFMRGVFKSWSNVTHQEYWEWIVVEWNVYQEDQMKSLLFTQDVWIDNLKLYLAQLMEKIEEETGTILQLPEEYDRVMHRGATRLQHETLKMGTSSIMTQINRDRFDPVLS